MITGRRKNLRPDREKKRTQLPLGELEPLACAFLTVLLALMFPGVTSQKAGFLERSTQFGVELNQSAGDTQLNRTGLTSNAASICEDQHVETIRHFNRQERQPDRHATRFGRKVIFQGTAIDRDFARSGPEEHTSDATFAAPGAQILLNFT
jgi:hypothetical protein